MRKECWKYFGLAALFFGISLLVSFVVPQSAHAFYDDVVLTAFLVLMVWNAGKGVSLLLFASEDWFSKEALSAGVAIHIVWSYWGDSLTVALNLGLIIAMLGINYWWPRRRSFRAQ